MALCNVHDTIALSQQNWNEKVSLDTPALDLGEPPSNPVIESAKAVYKHTNIVKINEEGVKTAARYIYASMINEGYSPRTWRDHPLHLQPPQVYSPHDPRTKACLDWIFLISSLNFNFWSEKDDLHDDTGRFGVEWREGWGSDKRKTWTGYWSLLAAVNKALEENIPITNPLFYASKVLCPDALLENIFRPAPQCTESMPLLAERISIMREVGATLVSKFGASYSRLLDHFNALYSNGGTALELVQLIVDEFPSFRDETMLDGQKACFWKRAQILVAETWAAFYPDSTLDAHPFFPKGISQLTMFADYRVPQILHHLRIISYPPSLLSLLTSRTLFSVGCRGELSIRAASILAVEAVRDEIVRVRLEDSIASIQGREDISSVMIDFFLWDLAKKIEQGEKRIEGISTREMVPGHRIRSIWY